MTASAHRYPDAAREDPGDAVHGLAVPDPYRWLEDADDPRVLRWTAEQETLYSAARAQWPDADRWHAHVAAFSALDRVLTPKVRGDRIFVPRQRAGEELPVLFVREGGRERPLLDLNAADPSGRTTLEAWQPSVEGDRLAYQISRDGTEDASLYVLDVRSGLTVDGPIDRIRGRSLGWLPGGEMLYYVRCSPAGAQCGDRRYHRRIWLHRVGSRPDADALVFGEGRGRTQFYTVAVTADGRWLTITAAEGTAPGSDVYLADLTVAAPDRPELRPVQTGGSARTRVHILPGTGPDGTMWLRTRHEAPFGRVVACTPARASADAWRTVITERPGAVLTDFAVLDGGDAGRPVGLAAWLRHSAAEITVHDLADGRQTGTVPLPGVGTIGDFSVRPGGGSEAWFAYTDFATPPRIMHYDARTRHTRVWAAARIAPGPRERAGGAARQAGGEAARRRGGDFDHLGVTARQESFTSRDGTTVRMFVVGPSACPDRPRPTILFGYGGFGTPVSAKFAPEVLSWTRAGGVFAAACVRGGGDEGERWHRDGCADRKQNSFDDFDAAAAHLVEAGWTQPGRLAIMGISNGGLLIGAALTQHPERYAAAVCMSPLLDMARYELSGLGPSWVPEYGSAADPGLRLGVDRHRQPTPPPADPSPPTQRRVGLPLLPRARRTGAEHGPADQSGRAALAVRGELPVRQGLPRPGPVPGTPLHRHRAPHRVGHGRPGDLRRRRRVAQAPHRHPSTASGAPRPAAAPRPRPDPADRPRNTTPARRSPAPRQTRRAPRTLAHLATPTPGPSPLVPPPRTTQPHIHPGQLAIGGCRTSTIMKSAKCVLPPAAAHYQNKNLPGAVCQACRVRERIHAGRICAGGREEGRGRWCGGERTAPRTALDRSFHA
ncbi:S9 family peptidase [Actinocrinis puniceicyclus]|uniref:prolyl oligopeptidase n=1 Tax=Actinocrinis puniceicyclus TaxID=977794 RepID=A0A8J8BDK3_9ACTN|nr:prolyl oligopeptidase family serine peptidase [Actinocrinis puniceicyclus]MBS2964251.1 S9 family peptidase [Actinocrinis puniceicyclus]